MAAREPLPADLVGQSFLVADAIDRVTRGRLRSADLSAPHRGVRVPTGDRSLVQRCADLSVAMPSTSCFAGPTAALLWGMPLPRRFAEVSLHVASAPGARAMRRPGVIGTERSADALVVRHPSGFALVDPVSTWIVLGRHLEVPDLVAAGDFLITARPPRRPLATLDQLYRASEDRAGRRGARVVRQAVELVRPGPRSRPESLLRVVIAAAGLPEPEINLELILPNGRKVIPDNFWPDFRVALEYDGGYHARPEQWSADIARGEEMTDAGILVVRVTARQLFGEPQVLLARLRSRLTSRGWAPTTRERSRVVRLEP